MLHAASIWLLVAAFAAAGLINARGAPAGKSNFVRWGYPDWWCYVAGGLEMTAAALIALPATREPGLVLGAAIIAAAILTISRHREYSHLAPLGVFVALLATAQASF
jgi:hypothetical protein